MFISSVKKLKVNKWSSFRLGFSWPCLFFLLQVCINTCFCIQSRRTPNNLQNKRIYFLLERKLLKQREMHVESDKYSSVVRNEDWFASLQFSVHHSKWLCIVQAWEVRNRWEYTWCEKQHNNRRICRTNIFLHFPRIYHTSTLLLYWLCNIKRVDGRRTNVSLFSAKQHIWDLAQIYSHRSEILNNSNFRKQHMSSHFRASHFRECSARDIHDFRGR